MVVFPHPDSPTRPKVSPGRIDKLTSSTAFTHPATFVKTFPLTTGKRFFRFRTSKSAVPDSPSGIFPAAHEMPPLHFNEGRVRLGPAVPSVAGAARGER